jgi:nucleotide-binding universal stress UspA family protein
MTPVLIGVVAVLAAAVAVLMWERLRHRRVVNGTTRRILFPFVGAALSQPALDAALRLARAEGATLVPAYLAHVSLTLPLDTPLPRQCAQAIPLLEAIEQRAKAYGVPVDSRIERGRNYRHALRELIESERFDRIVVAAAAGTSSDGFSPGDIAWLLENASGEIVVLRPGRDRALPQPVGNAPLTRPDPQAENRSRTLAHAAQT